MAAETKIKKKIFIRIVGPKLFNEQIIGETPVTDPRTLLGRNMRINLMGITNEPRDQNVEIKLNLNSLKGDSVGTEIIGYSLLPAFIRKLIRKEKRRVDDSFIINTSDNRTVRIKPFLLTIHIVSNSIMTALRKKTQEIVKAEALKLTFEALVTEVLSRRLQDKLRKDLAKLYPLKSCEIKAIEIVTEQKKKTEEKEVVVVEPAAEKKEEENNAQTNN